LATDLAWGCHWTKNGAYDLAGEARCVRLQLGHSLLLIVFHGGASLLDLILSAGAGFIHGLIPRLGSLLTASFLILEDFLPRLTEALFIFSGASLGGGDIGARFFHSSLSAVTTLGEDGNERAMNDQRVEAVENR
jgi:hypothetical protein